MTGHPEIDVLILIFGQIWTGIILALATLGVVFPLCFAIAFIRPMRQPAPPPPWMPPPSMMDMLRAEQERVIREQAESAAALSSKGGGRK